MLARRRYHASGTAQAAFTNLQQSIVPKSNPRLGCIRSPRDSGSRLKTRLALILLDLMGGVALLLWGLHMVQSGVLRAFGPDLRRFLGKALRNRFSAFAAGL